MLIGLCVFLAGYIVCDFKQQKSETFGRKDEEGAFPQVFCILQESTCYLFALFVKMQQLNNIDEWLTNECSPVSPVPKACLCCTQTVFESYVQMIEKEFGKNVRMKNPVPLPAQWMPKRIWGLAGDGT